MHFRFNCFVSCFSGSITTAQAQEHPTDNPFCCCCFRCELEADLFVIWYTFYDCFKLSNRHTYCYFFTVLAWMFCKTFHEWTIFSSHDSQWLNFVSSIVTLWFCMYFSMGQTCNSCFDSYVPFWLMSDVVCLGEWWKNISTQETFYALATLDAKLIPFA